MLFKLKPTEAEKRQAKEHKEAAKLVQLLKQNNAEITVGFAEGTGEWYWAIQKIGQKLNFYSDGEPYRIQNSAFKVQCHYTTKYEAENDAVEWLQEQLKEGNTRF